MSFCSQKEINKAAEGSDLVDGAGFYIRHACTSYFLRVQLFCCTIVLY